MPDETRKTSQPLALTAVAGVGLLICAAAFLGWIIQGPEMFLTMAENSLSWCF